MGGGAGGLLLGLACERFDSDFIIFDPCLPVLLIIQIVVKSMAVLLTSNIVRKSFIGLLWSCQGFHLQNVSICLCAVWFAIHKGTNYVVPNRPGDYA